MQHAHQTSLTPPQNVPLDGSVNDSPDTLFLMACDRFCDDNNDTPLSAPQFSEAFYLLIDEVSSETKQAVARAVANTPHTPRAIALYFAMESIDIAAPVLSRSKTFGQLDLLRILEATSVEHAQVIAERDDLGRTVIQRLYALQDQALDAKLEANDTIEHNIAEKSAPTMFAAIHGQLDLSSKTRATEEAKIEDAQAPQQSVSKSATHKLLKAAARGKRLNVEADTSDEPIIEFGDQSFGDAVERAARLGSRQSVGVLLTKFMQLELNTAFQVLEDKSGDTLAVALKSQNVIPEQANRILMLTFPPIGLSVQNAQRAIRFYDQITPEACESAVAQWPKAEKPSHEPVLADTQSTRAPRDTGHYHEGRSVHDKQDQRRSA